MNTATYITHISQRDAPPGITVEVADWYNERINFDCVRIAQTYYEPEYLAALESLQLALAAE